MEPEVRHNADGIVTYSITRPAASAQMSMLAQEERLMAALNAVGRAGARHMLGGFDADGQPLTEAGRIWTTKGKVAKIYETPLGELMLERHLYQNSSGGATFCPLEGAARITGGTATPHLAHSLSHQYANARAVVRDLEEKHGRKLAPSYVADIAQAVAEAAAQPVVEQNAHSAQSPARAGQQRRPEPGRHLRPVLQRRLQTMHGRHHRPLRRRRPAPGNHLPRPGPRGGQKRVP